VEIIKLKKSQQTGYIERNRFPLIVITEEPAFSNVAYTDFAGIRHNYDNEIAMRLGRKTPTNVFFLLQLHASGYLWFNEVNFIGFSSE
jgi:hypothetical protein